MAVYEGSRYTQTRVEQADGSFEFIIRDINDYNPRKAVLHQWKEGDNIDALATHYFGNSQYWWAIMDANTAYLTPLDIKVGDWIRIPDFREVLNRL